MQGETVDRVDTWFTNRRTKYKKAHGALPRAQLPAGLQSDPSSQASSSSAVVEAASASAAPSAAAMSVPPTMIMSAPEPTMTMASSLPPAAEVPFQPPTLVPPPCDGTRADDDDGE
eukprot:COSAG01_NODE_16645_length_1218_cov_1.504021_2_plen_115_part_01